MSTPALSVVVPTRNRAHHLPDAVDSALGQDGVDVEVIVVDNDSTDDTPAVMKRHAPRWGERVLYLWQENAERSAARNRGMRDAQAGYIAFLDSDDVWRPHHARMCLAALREHPDAAVAYGEYGLIATDGRVIRDHVPRPMGEGDELRRDLCLKRLIIHPTEAVIRRSALGDAGFDEESVGGEDWLLWATLAARSRLHPVGAPTVWMRLHPRTSSSTAAMTTRGLLRATEKVIGAGLPHRLGISPARIRAINRMHCAYTYYLAGQRREASRLLVAALREWPGIWVEAEFWRVWGRLCVGTELSRRIRSSRQSGRGPSIEVPRPRPR